MQLQARPSSLARLISCPGSLRACAMAPAWMDEAGDNFVRDEGTACHHFAHQTAIGALPSLGDVAPNGIAFDTDMRDAVALYLGTIDSYKLAHPYYEQTIAIPGVGSGTPDLVGFDGSCTIYIADLKYGYRTVDVWPNYQLIAYAMGAAQWFGLPLAKCKFHFAIVQPRRWHTAGPVRSAMVTGAQMLPYVEEIHSAVAAANQANAPLTPGKHCDYCPARAMCPALRQTVTDTVCAMPEALPFEYAELELQFLRKHSEHVNAYISGLEAQIEHGLRAGKRSKHFEMRAKNGSKVWANPDVIRVLAQLSGVKIDKQPELITPTQAIKAGVPAELVNMYSTRTPGKVTLENVDPSRWSRIFQGN